jgi:two-component system response regulator
MKDKFILLVEDNPDDEALMLRALRKSRIQTSIVIAHDGVEALDFLLARGAHAGRDQTAMPLAVLLDLKLPKISGLEVLRYLRDDPRTRRLPVILLTSSDEERDMVEGFRLGASSYVRKTADFGGFIETIRRIGESWFELDPPLVSGANVAGEIS